MDKDEIIDKDEVLKMAKLAKLGSAAWFGFVIYNTAGVKNLELFAKLVAEKAAKREREACAKVCEEEGKLWSEAGCTDTQTFGLCATVIRARGEA